MDYGREGLEIDYAQKIQTFHRFLIDHLGNEGRNTNVLSFTSPILSQASPISYLLGISGKNVILCSNCKVVQEKHHLSHVVDLIYPQRVSSILPCAMFLPDKSFLFSSRWQILLKTLISVASFRDPFSDK